MHGAADRAEAAHVDLQCMYGVYALYVVCTGYICTCIGEVLAGARAGVLFLDLRQRCTKLLVVSDSVCTDSLEGRSSLRIWSCVRLSLL